jgi:hypothetical protein
MFVLCLSACCHQLDEQPVPKIIAAVAVVVLVMDRYVPTHRRRGGRSRR